jgi:hypothetical protein
MKQLNFLAEKDLQDYLIFEATKNQLILTEDYELICAFVPFTSQDDLSLLAEFTTTLKQAQNYYTQIHRGVSHPQKGEMYMWGYRAAYTTVHI